MAVQVTDEFYPEHNERERYVSGEHASGPIYDGGRMLLTIGGNPEIEMKRDRVEDLRDVLTAALELMDRD